MVKCTHDVDNGCIPMHCGARVGLWFNVSGVLVVLFFCYFSVWFRAVGLSANFWPHIKVSYLQFSPISWCEQYTIIASAHDHLVSTEFANIRLRGVTPLKKSRRRKLPPNFILNLALTLTLNSNPGPKLGLVFPGVLWGWGSPKAGMLILVLEGHILILILVPQSNSLLKSLFCWFNNTFKIVIHNTTVCWISGLILNCVVVFDLSVSL